MQQVVFLLVAAVLGVVIFKLRGDAAKQRKAVMARLAAERDVRGDYSPTAELFREVGVSHDPAAPLPLNIAFPDGPLPGGNAVVGDLRSADFGTDAEAPVFERLSDLELDASGPAVAAESAVSAGSGDPATNDASVAPAAPAVSAATAQAGATDPSDLRTLFKGISMPAGLKPLGPLVPRSANFVTAATPSVVHAGLDAEFERLECTARWVEPTVAQTERNGMRGLVTIYPNPVAAIDLQGNPLFPGVETGQVVVRMLAL